jgi:hypothetical protein
MLLEEAGMLQHKRSRRSQNDHLAISKHAEPLNRNHQRNSGLPESSGKDN